MSKTTWKTIGYIALALVLIVCLVVDGLWVYVKFFAPEKTVVDTFYFSTISTQESEADDDTYIIKVKYYSNTNGNGLEAIEIMFTTYTDSTASGLYSYGIQLVMDSYSTSPSISIDSLEYKEGSEVEDYTEWQFPLTWNHYSSDWYSVVASNATYSFYESGDQFETFTMGSSSTFADDGFIINLNEDSDNIYRISFKGNVYDDEEDHTASNNYLGYTFASASTYAAFDSQRYYVNHYGSYDVFYFLASIYQSIDEELSNGVSSSSWVSFGDLFNYEYYDGKAYVSLDSDNVLASDKISQLETTYGAIYIEKTADGLSTASQSMFNAVNGSAQYNNGYGDDSIDSQYGTARQVLTVDMYDFEYVLVSDSYYALQLSETFLSNWYSSRNTLLLSVQLDLDALEKKGVTFYGFVDDTFDGFTVYECYTYTTADGEKVITEVNYA